MSERTPPLSESALIDGWADLEVRLAAMLLAPAEGAAWRARLGDVLTEMRSLLTQDTDGSLYLLFQQAAMSSVGYSASHGLVCACLCELLAPSLGLQAPERDSLSQAALTMNLAMTALQDELTAQTSAPSVAQKRQIDAHPAEGVRMLGDLGVQDATWLDIIAHHHDNAWVQAQGEASRTALLTRILMATDRYTAIIAPRETRSGRCITDSARSVLARGKDALDPIGHALLRTMGICPPGTFVRLDDQRVAVVVLRTDSPGTPSVVPVQDAQGHPVVEPPLLDTAQDDQGIEAALVARTVRVRLNHVRMLRLARAGQPA